MNEVHYLFFFLGFVVIISAIIMEIGSRIKVKRGEEITEQEMEEIIKNEETS